jgi:glyoxylase-like metal-dependent hydrolase (beta-lactamase superfamily II)
VYWVSAYLVDGLLIDTGCPLTASEFVDTLDGREVTQAVNTHFHEDHIGANRLVADAFHVDVFAHPDAIPHIHDFPDLPWYREACWGRPGSFTAKPIPAELRTPNRRFAVIETPGHAEGHVALVEPEQGWCFSGDLYVGRRLNVAGPETCMADMIASMKRLLEFPAERLVLFTSMRTVEPDGKQALAAAINYLEALCRDAQAMRDRGASVAAIRDELLGGESPLDRITNGRYSTLRLIEEALDTPLSADGNG